MICQNMAWPEDCLQRIDSEVDKFPYDEKIYGKWKKYFDHSSWGKFITFVENRKTKIEAIKYLRDIAGIGLKEAKDEVELIQDKLNM